MSDSTTVRSLLLTDANDLDLSAPLTLRTATGLQAMKQAVRSSILLFFGEWFLNIEQGTKWREIIFVKNPDLALITTEIRGRITAVLGVKSVDYLSVTYDSTARTLSASYQATCDFGQFDDVVVTP